MPLTVLVIDDSKTIRRSAAGFLDKSGCQVVSAVDGFDALAKVVSHRPDIIFADIMMPRLDGYQTCALIKNNAQYRDIPVVLLSSKDGLFDRARGRLVGADAHLAKPFAEQDLLDTVASLLPAVDSSDAMPSPGTPSTGSPSSATPSTGGEDIARRGAAVQSASRS